MARGARGHRRAHARAAGDNESRDAAARAGGNRRCSRLNNNRELRSAPRAITTARRLAPPLESRSRVFVLTARPPVPPSRGLGRRLLGRTARFPILLLRLP